MHNHQPWPKLHPSIFKELQCAAIIALILTACTCYVRFASLHISPGFRRLTALLPVISLLPVLPAAFSFMHCRVLAAFFFSWLALFKLLLLSFGRGPLDPSQSFLVFLFTTIFPVKLQPGHHKSSIISMAEVLYLLSKTLVLWFSVYLYRYHPLYDMYTFLSLLSCHLYLGLELVMALIGITVSIILNMSVEPQFNDPFLATSLRDFWSRRWNVMVSHTLRQVVYDPITPRMGPASGLIASFFVSGLIHEIMFYYIASSSLTGEVMAFFLLQGMCIIVEHVAKRVTIWRPHTIVARLMTVSFVMISAFWLVFNPILRNGADQCVLEESIAVVTFLEDAVRAVVTRLKSIA